jgi:hypothetical protein
MNTNIEIIKKIFNEIKDCHEEIKDKWDKEKEERSRIVKPITIKNVTSRSIKIEIKKEDFKYINGIYIKEYMIEFINNFFKCDAAMILSKQYTERTVNNSTITFHISSNQTNIDTFMTNYNKLYKANFKNFISLVNITIKFTDYINKRIINNYSSLLKKEELEKIKTDINLLATLLQTFNIEWYLKLFETTIKINRYIFYLHFILLNKFIYIHTILIIIKDEFIKIPDNTKYTLLIDFIIIFINNIKVNNLTDFNDIIKNSTINISDTFFKIDNEYIKIKKNDYENILNFYSKNISFLINYIQDTCDLEKDIIIFFIKKPIKKEILNNNFELSYIIPRYNDSDNFDIEMDETQNNDFDIYQSSKIDNDTYEDQLIILRYLRDNSKNREINKKIFQGYNKDIDNIVGMYTRLTFNQKKYFKQQIITNIFFKDNKDKKIKVLNPYGVKSLFNELKSYNDIIRKIEEIENKLFFNRTTIDITKIKNIINKNKESNTTSIFSFEDIYTTIYKIVLKLYTYTNITNEEIIKDNLTILNTLFIKLIKYFIISYNLGYNLLKNKNSRFYKYFEIVFKIIVKDIRLFFTTYFFYQSKKNRIYLLYIICLLDHSLLDIFLMDYKSSYISIVDKNNYILIDYYLYSISIEELLISNSYKEKYKKILQVLNQFTYIYIENKNIKYHSILYKGMYEDFFSSIEYTSNKYSILKSDDRIQNKLIELNSLDNIINIIYDSIYKYSSINNNEIIYQKYSSHSNLIEFIQK